MRRGLNIRGFALPAHGRRPCWEGPGGGRPLPVAGIRGYHPGKRFETETSVVVVYIVIATKQIETNQQAATVFLGQ